MIPADLAPDVGRIEPVIVPVGDRRDRSQRQRKFPEIEEKESEKDLSEKPDEPGAEPPTPDSDDETDHTIDILVIGSIVPGRQHLPGHDLPLLIH
jgi:hypothetical protein